MPGVTEIVSAVIPCLDEEDAIGAVVSAVLAQGVAEVIVVDGASRDGTAERAAAAGARVVVEARRGYGRAVQAGLAVLRQDASMVVFLDGDGSDPAELIPALIAPIAAGEAVFVSGSRIRGKRDPGSLSPPQIAAGLVGDLLLRMVYGARFSDLSPFRAIRRDALLQLGMRDTTYGWDLEMLMRVAAAGLPGRGDSSRPALPDRRRVESVGQSYRQHQGCGGSRDHIRSPRAQLTPRATA